MSFKAKYIYEKEKRDLVQKFEAQLNTYRYLLHNQAVVLENKPELQQSLQRIFKRNRLAIRLKNRCTKTRRAKSVIRFFQLSRISFREAARSGNLLGVKRASW